MDRNSLKRKMTISFCSTRIMVSSRNSFTILKVNSIEAMIQKNNRFTDN